MSGVLKRNRKVSEFKFFSVAIAIRTETNKLMANSKVVPKSYRLLNAVPTVETARSLVYNIVRSDAFYPSNSFNAAERRRYLTLAIADCNQLVQDMQCLLDMGVVEGMPSAPDARPGGKVLPADDAHRRRAEAAQGRAKEGAHPGPADAR